MNAQLDPAPPEAVRVRLAASGATPGAVLATLAHDPALIVRSAVAMNPTAPPAAQNALATDEDERVRAILARRLAALAPTLDRNALGRHSARVLASLAMDEAVRVRAAVADIVKEMPDAPRELILRLAHDAALPVAGPVLRLSPVLTVEDLLGLIAYSATAAEQVAQRPELPDTLADAVAATTDTAAVRALLTNSSAQIREATLDALAAGAASVPDWHEPLSKRPVLSARSAILLSSFVSDALMGVLATRTDLPADTLEELRGRVCARMTRTAGSAVAVDALADAQSLRRRGALDEAAVLEAARLGHKEQVGARLVVAADLPYAAVERAVGLRSSKALVSLVWKAGFSMRAGLAVQAVLAELGPGQLLHAQPGGAFPLSVEEMRFHIDMLNRTD